MHTAHACGDNCGSQFENRHTFKFLATFHIPAETGSPLHLYWHFFAPCHGENVSDSEGATVKNYYAEKEKNNQWRLSTPRDVFEACRASELTYYLRPATHSEREAKYGGQPHGPGTAQKVMTKVRRRSPCLRLNNHRQIQHIPHNRGR